MKLNIASSQGRAAQNTSIHLCASVGLCGPTLLQLSVTDHLPDHPTFSYHCQQ